MGWLETRRLPALFALATLLPLAALCWLGVRTLAQDHELERQRRSERLKVAAERVALDIERDLQRIEANLVEGRGIRLHDGGVTSTDGKPIVFQPQVPNELGSLPIELAAAATLEFQQQDFPAAIAEYERVARIGAPAARGEALVALGGLLRRQRRLDEALRAYDELAVLGRKRVAGGQPAALVALQGRGKALEDAGDRERLRETGAALSHALSDGGWTIDRTTFDIYRELAERWGAARIDEDAVQRAESAAELWRVWQRGELPLRGRIFVEAASPVLAVWVTGADGPSAALMSPSTLEPQWRHLWVKQGLSAAIWRPDGQPVFGAVSDDPISLVPRETGLPFGVTFSASAAFPPASGTLRRNAVIGGVLVAAILMIAGAYGLYRVTTQELLLARQQSDFVAAVSHEFRTPLTSMRHLIDLLARRGIASEERRTHYYALLDGETERLQRMVETLLSFGRIDAGAHVWRLEPLRVEDVVDAAIEEFRREASGRDVLVEIDPGLPGIRGDREALGRALWNLLENAAKYSTPQSPIRVFATLAPKVASGFLSSAASAKAGSRKVDASRVKPDREIVLIGVQDRGMGIPAAEQRRVFDKFVRGAEAKRSGTRGVGVGLALVKRVAEGHGGAVTLESQEGHGSTFTLVLPAA